MGQFTDYDGGSTYVHVGPLSFFLAYPDYGVIYRFVPKALQRSDLEVTWLVRDDALEGERLRHRAADLDVAGHQRGGQAHHRGQSARGESRYYVPGPLAGMEAVEQRFVEWYLREIQ